MKSDRRMVAAKRWSAVAAGRLDDEEVRTWLQGVARALLKSNDEKDANKRRLGVLRAVGLEGRLNPEPLALADLLEHFGIKQFSDLTDDVRSQLLAIMDVLLGRTLGREELEQRIRRVLKD